MRRHYHNSLFGLAALASVHFGCAGMMQNAAEEVTPSMVAGAVEGLADPDTQRELLAAVDEGRVQEMSARLSAGILDGMLDTLEDPTRRQRLETVLTGLTSTAAGTAMDSMIARATDEKTQARMRVAMRGMMTELVTSVFETVDNAGGSSESRNTAIGVAVHEIAKQATLGFQDALDETRRDRVSGTMPQEDGSLVIAANKASDTGNRILWTLGVGLAAVALGLAATLVWAVRKNRLRMAELEERDDALLLLSEAIKSTAASTGSDELYTVLKTSMRDRTGGQRILKVLGDQGHHLLGLEESA